MSDPINHCAPLIERPDEPGEHCDTTMKAHVDSSSLQGMDLDVGTQMALHVGDADGRAEGDHAHQTRDADENCRDAAGKETTARERLVDARGGVGRPRMKDHAGSGPGASAG